MKAKKLIPLFALMLGLSSFGGCANADQKIAFSNYWNQDSTATAEAINETLTYDVTFEAEETSLVDYKLSYTDGKYTTNLVSAMEDGKTVYTYKTVLNITAHYNLNGSVYSSNDVVTSTVKFFAGEYGLQPISSEKEIKASSPTASYGTLEECYQTYHYTLKVAYNADGSAGTSTITQYSLSDPSATPISEEKSFDIDQKKFSYLDNEQLLFALRGIKNSTTSAKFLVYSPFSVAVQKVACSFSTEASAEFSFHKNGSEEKVKSAITYRPVTVVLDEQNPGATQTAWIAKTTTPTNNTNRNVMLRLETPLSYGLGTMVYTLSSVSYQ